MLRNSVHDHAVSNVPTRESRYEKKGLKAHRQLAEVQALQEAGQFAEALKKARSFVAKNKKEPAGWRHLGRVLIDTKQWAEAKRALDRANTLAPDNPSTLINLSLASYHLDDYEAARSFGQKATAIEPENPLALNNLGMALIKLDDFDNAALVLRRALSVRPDLAPALSNYGAALNRLGQFSDALDVLMAALKLNKSDPYTFVNIGNSLRFLGRDSNAIDMYNQALALDPGMKEGSVNICNVYNKNNLFDASFTISSELIEREPKYVKAHSVMADALIGLGRIDDAKAAAESVIAIEPASITAQALLVSLAARADDYDAADYLRKARRFSDLHDIYRTDVLANPADDAAKLRVGFIGGDFRRHPVGYFLKQLFTEYDRERFAFFIYHNAVEYDDLSEFFVENSAAFRNVNNKLDRKVAQEIADDRLHILIDLAGYTKYTRLSALVHKPAPVQMTWLGYYASTGVSEVDYILADPYVVPDDCEAEFSEAVLRFPDSYLCFSEPDCDVPVRPAPVSENGTVTFGSFNNLNKVTDNVLALWARVLNATPGSRLMLKTMLLNRQDQRERIIERFAAEGIDLDRLILEGPSPREALLDAYNKVDIALDPFPYGGGTTSAEALWMGVPVLTKRGDRFLARMGGSIVSNVGLGDWVAEDDDDYVAKAAAFATDAAKLIDLKHGLRQRVLASPLFDGRNFARKFETLMTSAWDAYRARNDGEGR